MGCKDGPNADVDFVRFKTVILESPLAGDSDAVVKVELCPGARLYSYTFSARVSEELVTAGTIPDILAIWQSQDSELKLVSYGCQIAEIRADLPGLEFPANMKLIAPPGVTTVLHLTYGHCT